MNIELTYDDSEWTPGEMAALAGIAFADLDDTDYSEYLDTRQRQKSCGDGVAIGGMVVDAKPELSRRVSASPAFAIGRAEGDQRAGALIREDLLHGDAVRCGVSKEE